MRSWRIRGTAGIRSGSGNITGYVSSEFILTGDAARQAAMEHAELMAIVSTDRLNARTEPSTDAKIWTQISNNERYHVAEAVRRLGKDRVRRGRRR